MMNMLSSGYFALFVIITFGFLLGRIKIRGISLDISAVIFVALFFGHFGVVIPADFQKMGLVLFLFTIGLQAGPGFFESFKEKGRNLIGMALVLIFSAGVITLLASYFLGISKEISAGLLTGALTSTPGLAAAIDVTQSPLASIGYGIAYPFGVIGVIVFVRLLPKLTGSSIKKADEEYENAVKSQHPEIVWGFFKVDNESVVGKSIGELRVRYMTNAVISRVMHNDNAFSPNPSTILNKGDIIKAVGTEGALKRVRLLIGPKTDIEIPKSKKFDVRAVLVTNHEVVNMTLAELNLHGTYGANITRIRRAGIDLVPTPQSRMKFGDKLVLACAKENMDQVERVFGNDNKRLSDTDFLPISLGIVLGVLVGKINLSFGSFSFSPGLSGGVLLIALILGRIGKTGPILWTMTGAANNLLRQLGLLLFLAAVGTGAGSQLVDTFNEFGMKLFIAGAAITLLPMIIGTLYAKYVLKMDILTLLGAITGSMTSTPGLAAIDSMTRTNASAVAYATVYPAAMVIVIIVVQLLGLF
jgi:putative transport protein